MRLCVRVCRCVLVCWCVCPNVNGCVLRWWRAWMVNISVVCVYKPQTYFLGCNDSKNFALKMVKAQHYSRITAGDSPEKIQIKYLK